MRALLLILLLAGCTQAYQVSGVDKTQLAQCYTGALVGFCVVNLNKNQAVVSQPGIMQGVGQVVGTINNTAVSSTLVGRVP
jgi:hypothetical protein